MRAIVSVVLATALVTTPLKLVLAQATQQEAVSVQQTVVPDSSGHRLIGVPPVTDNTSRLWEPLASEDAFADIFAEDGSLAGPTPIPKGAEIAIYIVVGLVLVAALLIGLLVLFSDAIGPALVLGAS